MSGKRTTLPDVFHEGGGRRPAVGGKGKGKTGKVWDWRDERVHSVMGLVQLHEGEYRRWHPNWGPSPGGNEDWQKFFPRAVGRGGLGADHFLCRHHQLQLSPMTSSPSSDLHSARHMAASGSGSTIVRRSAGPPPSAGQPLAAAYEARNVFIINLPEVFLLYMYKCTAKHLYHEWQQCEAIIGKRPRRGHR